MSNWLDCIISYIDLIGIGRGLRVNTSDAISKMISMHAIVYKAANSSLQFHHNVYYWNDSVLLLAHPQSVSDYQPIMREVSSLKRRIDGVCKSFAICMKGQTIPGPTPCAGVQHGGGPTEQTKSVYIRASSMAFANVFEVEKQLGKRKKAWYIDSRIAQHITTTRRCTSQCVTLHPRQTAREVYMFAGDLWREDLKSAQQRARV